jgi:hypothetical protein
MGIGGSICLTSMPTAMPRQALTHGVAGMGNTELETAAGSSVCPLWIGDEFRDSAATPNSRDNRARMRARQQMPHCVHAPVERRARACSWRSPRAGSSPPALNGLSRFDTGQFCFDKWQRERSEQLCGKKTS